MAAADTFAEKQQRGRNYLRSIAGRPEVREALFVASPTAESTIRKWCADQTGKPDPRTERTLARYLARMASRPTPFGLFAGCSTGAIGSATRLTLGPRARYAKHTRLDHGYLAQIKAEALRRPDVRSAVRHFPNNSLYRSAGYLRYAESVQGVGAQAYKLVAVELTTPLEECLVAARDGATLRTIADSLVAADPEISFDEALAFALELADAQILVSSLAPAVTSEDYLGGVIDELGKAPQGASTAVGIREAQQVCADLDAAGLGVAPERYQSAAESLTGLPVKPNVGRFLQVDLTKPADASLDEATVTDIVTGVDVLQALSPRWVDGLRRFREKFTERYEGAAVPLAEALDEEAGIGFDQSVADDNNLLDGLPFSPDVSGTGGEFGPRETFLLRKLEECWRSGNSEIRIEPKEVEAIKSLSRRPEAISVTCALGRDPDGQVFAWVKGAHGPSGARMLGRFCHCDEQLRAGVERHLRQEEACRPRAVFAEIVHVPEGRLGNIQARPVLRKFEIPYLSQSAVASEFQIAIDDLIVNIEGERIVLRSKRLNREVIPRLSTAHNYRNGLSMYRFLGALQNQGVFEGLGWTWGALGQAAYLPRVVSGSVVLARAQWKLTTEEFKDWAPASPEEAFAAVQAWRGAKRVPRWILLVDGDNELAVDLDNVMSVDMFVDLLADRSQALVVELLPGPDELLTRGPEGSYTHEIVLPLTFPPHRESPEHRAPAVVPSADRFFGLGSEWLYLKLYTGTGGVDQLLKGPVRDLVREICSAELSDSWFFIRYGDPDWHLRLRFHGAPGGLLREVLPRVQAAFAPGLKSGAIWRSQTDVYRREIERYGGPEGLSEAERVFRIDSETTIDLLIATEELPVSMRWTLCIQSFDRFLGDMGFALDAKLALCAPQRKAMASRYPGKALTRALGDKFRKVRRLLETAVREPAPEIDDILGRRSERLRPVFERLRRLETDGRLSSPVAELAMSYLHMHANRLMRSSSTKHELVIYDFLGRLYESQIARRRSAGLRAE